MSTPLEAISVVMATGWYSKTSANTRFKSLTPLYTHTGNVCALSNSLSRDTSLRRCSAFTMTEKWCCKIRQLSRDQGIHTAISLSGTRRPRSRKGIYVMNEDFMSGDLRFELFIKSFILRKYLSGLFSLTCCVEQDDQIS